MKLFKLATVVFLSIFFTTGCTAETESPEDLAKMPVYEQEKKVIYEDINKLLINSSSLLLPSNSKEVGKINEVDLDNDGIDEIVVFEKKNIQNEEENQVGFIVLSQEMNYKDEISYRENDNVTQGGDSIEYANFYDLDNDGYKEIVLLVKTGDKTNIQIYKFMDKEITNVCTIDYPTWIENNENLNNVKIKIGYIDEDPQIDILTIHHDTRTNEAYVSILNFNAGMKLKDYVKIENVKNLSDLYITIGNIAKSTKGVILDIPTYKENNYITQILYLEDNTLKKAFKDNDKNIMKAYYIPIEDINKDKVIDIPVVNGNGHAYSSKSSANISWYRWNGKQDEQSGLLFTSQIYYNYKYNYKLLLPNNLVDKINIQQENNGENVSFNFNYYDNITMEPKNLFTISAMEKVIADDSKNIANKTGIALGETENHSFILYLNDLEELEKLDITSEALVEYFSLIY